MNTVWKMIVDHLVATIAITILLILVVSLAFGYLDMDSTPILQALYSGILAALTGLFGACVVGLVFERSDLDARVGRKSVKSVLETIFEPETKIYDVVSPEDMQHFGVVAIAAAKGVDPKEDAYGLVGLCVDEACEMLDRPYHEVEIARSYTFDASKPGVLLVNETLKNIYYNRTPNDIHDIKAWKEISTAATDLHKKEKSVNAMTVRTAILSESQHGCGDDFPRQETISGSIENDSIIWHNETTFTIPANTEGFVVTVTRLFYVAIDDCRSACLWSMPVKKLTYVASFSGVNVHLSALFEKCKKCIQVSSCDDCGNEHKAVAVKKTKNNIQVLVNEWASTRSKLEISWIVEQSQ